MGEKVFFTLRELSCRCGRPKCDAVPVIPPLLTALVSLRKEWGKPLLITSAARCKIHNAAVGGKETSWHLVGRAVDMWLSDPSEVRAVATLAEQHGFRGFGLGKRLLHIDIRPGLRAEWFYADM